MQLQIISLNGFSAAQLLNRNNVLHEDEVFLKMTFCVKNNRLNFHADTKSTKHSLNLPKNRQLVVLMTCKTFAFNDCPKNKKIKKKFQNSVKKIHLSPNTELDMM